MIKPFKIRVENESHSRDIQEWLFSKGYSWANGSKEVENTIYPFLFLYQDLDSCEEEVTLEEGNCEDLFNTDDLPEAWFYDGQLQDRPKPIGTLTYRQLIEAQLRGEKVQIRASDGWVDLAGTISRPIYALDSPATQAQFRVKPKPRFCNGIELDECLTEAPELGDNYYYPDPMHVDYYNLKLWVGDADDVYWFELGFAYGSSESAAKHGHAMGITMEG